MHHPPLRSTRLLDQVRERTRYMHYSLRTEEAYVYWVRAFIRFHKLRHPRDMGRQEIEAFLTYLAVERHVAPSTHKQALAGILFLYRQGDTQRLHAIDACQLLGLDRTFKYQQATAQTFANLIAACTHRARARADLAAWVLFNVLTGNAGAHLKNLSFHVDASGIALAPFYDLVSTESYHTNPGSHPIWPQTPLSTQVGGATTFAQVNAARFARFAEELGLTRTATRRLLSEYVAKIEKAADELVEEFERRDVPTAVRAGQLRVIRTIRLVVLREMVRRLAAG